MNSISIFANSAIDEPTITTDYELSNIIISCQDVKYVLLNLELNEACGLDTINHRLLKESANIISKHLTYIYMVNRSVNTKPISIFDDAVVSRRLADLHDRFVIVPADKASSNVVFICKTYYYSCLQKELVDNNDVDISTYQCTNFTKEEIVINHRSVLSSLGINTLHDDADLPSLYWIPKLHKDPYKHRFIAGSAKCSTKPLSK